MLSSGGFMIPKIAWVDAGGAGGFVEPQFVTTPYVGFESVKGFLVDFLVG